MVGQHDLLGDLVELGGAHGRQGIVLAVDGAGLKSQIDLVEGHRRRVGAERLAEELPGVGARHAQVDAVQVRGRLDVALLAQVELAGAEIGDRQDLDVHLGGDLLEQLVADRPVEDRLLVRHVAQQVARGEDRPLGQLARDVLGRDQPDLEIAALHRRDLGALGEQGRVEVDLDVELVRRRALQPVLEDVEHLGVPLLGDRGRGDPDHLLLLREARLAEHRQGQRHSAERQDQAPVEAADLHGFVSLWWLFCRCPAWSDCPFVAPSRSAVVAARAVAAQCRQGRSRASPGPG